MESVCGWLSILPPVIVIVLAILTKNVLASLLMGVFIGLFLSCRPMGLFQRLGETVSMGLDTMTAVAGNGENLHLIIFLALLGGLIAILTAAGCGIAFSSMAVRRIRTRTHAQLFTFFLGCVIFIDDYFNAITVGNVMVPITDKFRISRAKLAYLIDSTSAPVTILMPVSSWVATVISLITPVMLSYGFSTVGMGAFLQACAFNYYAWLTLLMVVLVAVTGLDIGPMRRFERAFRETGRDRTVFADVNEDVIDRMSSARRGTAGDMILLICVLVLLAVALMLQTGGFFSGGSSLSEAFMNCDSTRALVYSSGATLLLAFFLFVPTKKLSFKQYNEAFIQGVKSMVTAICILLLSWTFSEVLGDGGLGTGRFIASMAGGKLPPFLMPSAVFLLSGFISFTTGASWGALAIMLPTSIAICAAVDRALIFVVLGAALAGAVFGDHCSPLSDTTILSSSGAGCKHLDHVSSQMPYALITAGISILGYLMTGLTGSPILPMAVCVAVMAALIFFLARRGRQEDARKGPLSERSGL